MSSSSVPSFPRKRESSNPLAAALLACLAALAPSPAHAQSSPQTLPEISVSATQEFVVEGEVIEFRLAAEPALPAPVTLRYRVAQSVGGDVLAAAEMRVSEVSLPAGYTGGVLSIRTAQDQAPVREQRRDAGTG